MEQRYLLTYDTDKEFQKYCWFETEKDMEEFIKKEANIKVTEKIEILGCRDIHEV